MKSFFYQIIRSGDPVAVEMFDTYSGTVMPSNLHLSEADIREIINYIDCSKYELISDHVEEILLE